MCGSGERESLERRTPRSQTWQETRMHAHRGSGGSCIGFETDYGGFSRRKNALNVTAMVVKSFVIYSFFLTGKVDVVVRMARRGWGGG